MRYLSRRSFFKGAVLLSGGMALGLTGCSNDDHSGEATSRTIEPENNDEQLSADEAPDEGNASEPNKSEDGPIVCDTLDEAIALANEKYDFFVNSDGKYQVLANSNQSVYGGKCGESDGSSNRSTASNRPMCTEEYPGIMLLASDKIKSWDQFIQNIAKVPIGSTICTYSTFHPWQTGRKIIGSQYVTQHLGWNPEEIEGIEIDPTARGRQVVEVMRSLGYTVYQNRYGSDTPSSFTWGYYKGTKWIETTEQVDQFALQYADIDEISLPVEKTKKGYFTLDTSGMSEGIYYYYLDGRVVEFVS